MRFFEVKVKYGKAADNGAIKTVTEVYALAAQTFTDAEHSIGDHIEPYVQGAFEVVGEKIAAYDDFIYSDAPKADDKFWLAKYAIVTIDQFTAKEKKEYHHVLIEALDVESATDVFNHMPGDATCRELVGIRESNVVECFMEL